MARANMLTRTGVFCDEETRRFWAWAKTARNHARRTGLDTPIAEHEYAVLLSFYDGGVEAFAAIALLHEWRAASDRARARIEAQLAQDSGQ